MKSLFYLSLVLILLGFQQGSFKPSWSPDPDDDAMMDIEILYDSLNIPEQYKAHVVTPVCENDKCYIVKIEFYWDLIGRFTAFDTLPGEGLTKLDHIPFTEQDYAKLDRLLKDANSPLASYSKEELVRDTRSSDIDGLTGATIQEIKDAVIGGGVYSCYTLWHIAYGKAVDSLKRKTASLFNQQFVEKLVKQQDQEINYFLLEHFSAEEFEQYLPQILHTIENGTGYYAKNAIEQIPKEIFADSLAQSFFAGYYPKLNYFSQVALLKKLSQTSLDSAMAHTLHQHLDDRSSAKNDMIKELLEEGQKP